MPQTSAKQTAPTRARFVVHQNAQGYWIASEKGGLVTGIFALQREAVHFALMRLCRHGGAHSNTATAQAHR